ncbi:MAG: PASTA domain-containing protein [Bacteroidales bacterium]|nr:PASTA domain-containing protein [Bacteroidales bacterium]
MNDFLHYLRSSIFIKNLLLAIGLAITLLIVLLLYLRIYTHHGRSIAIPDFSDLPVEDAGKYITKRKLRYEILDSVYVAEKDGGIIVDQYPKPGSLVKKNRKIYFTINAHAPEKILMPDLVGITLREARTKIEIAGLKIGKLIYRYDMAINVVLEQHLNGEPIEAGDTVPKGISVDLILGKGLANERSMVPNLIGLSVEEAKNKAADALFAISTAIPDNSVINNDTITPFIFRQHPVRAENVRVPLGTQITLWITIDSAKLSGGGIADSTIVWDDAKNTNDDYEDVEEDTYSDDYIY